MEHPQQQQQSPDWLNRGPARECFRNAWGCRSALRFAILGRRRRGHGPRQLPFYHTLCLDEECGTVVDPTWPIDVRAAYLGVYVPTEMHLRILTETGTFDVLGKGAGLEHDLVAEHWQ